MQKHSPLAPSQLRVKTDITKIKWESSQKAPKGSSFSPISFQPRALEALQLALTANDYIGYNVYVSGEANLGRINLLRAFLKPNALKRATPPDLAYVQNFSDASSPILISFPAGMGKEAKEILKETLSKIRSDFAHRFEMNNFTDQRGKIVNKLQRKKTSLLKKMNVLAGQEGFNIEIDENGMLGLSPLLNGRKLDDTEIAQLNNKFRAKLKHKGEKLANEMSIYVNQLNTAEEKFHDEELLLDKEIMKAVLEENLTPVRQQFQQKFNSVKIQAFLEALHNDIIENIDIFTQRDDLPSSLPNEHVSPTGESFRRYEINLFVDNSSLQGAPIVVEDYPTMHNLLGCIERESEMGSLTTDFTLIKSGSIHRANGGFLIIHIENLLSHPGAWEGLLRNLCANHAKIDDYNAENNDGQVRTKGLSPEPLALDVKIILVGNEDLYEHLLANDERFAKLFRLKAPLTDFAPRNHKNIQHYLNILATIINDCSMLPFNRDALAWLVDFSSLICEDQYKLSLRFPVMKDLMYEASTLAKQCSLAEVDTEILEKTFARQTYRMNLIEEIYLEEYSRKIIKVQTTGKETGQVNGLSVSWQGNFEFGLPHRISCTVGVGNEGIIDLEREAELGGPIHTKAMMILKSFLTNLFAQDKPIMLAGSLYFEQNYGEIEGDSASGAELIALLSAIAKVPVRLDLAFTGAVNHMGQILAVGGVSKKIEGFFKVCMQHGFTGTQGVIIPYDNLAQLMLSQEILDAASNGKFFVYTARTIEDAIELLMGIPAGKRHKNGRFPSGSLYSMVNSKLEAFRQKAQPFLGTRA